jgi:hypothetical protein
MAKKRKKATGFGELPKAQKQPKASNTERSGPVQPPTFLDDDEENLISMPEEMVAYLNELKARKMGLEEFRQEFGEELDILELSEGSMTTHSVGSAPSTYEGQVLAIRYRGKTGPAEMFPMPEASGPVPDDTFDYLASFRPY